MMQKRNGEYATDDEATRSPILVFQNVTAGYSAGIHCIQQGFDEGCGKKGVGIK